MSKIISSIWFTEIGSRSPIGIIKVFDEITKKTKFYIGSGLGVSIKEDEQKIHEGGSKFPVGAGKALLGK